MINFKQTVTVALLAASIMLATEVNAFYGVPVTGPEVAIIDSIVPIDANTWTYTYSLTNITDCFGNCGDTAPTSFGTKSIYNYILAVREFAIPYFDDANVTLITAPANWTSQVVANDIFGLGSGAHALVWTALTDNSGIALGATLGGLSYESTFGPGKGPFSTTFGGGWVVLGDPAMPLSPSAIAAGIAPSAIPVPAAVWLFNSGLGLLGFINRRKC